MAYSPCLRLHARLRTVHQPKNHQTLHYERSKQEMNVKPSTTTFDLMIVLLEDHVSRTSLQPFTKKTEKKNIQFK